MRSDLDVAVLAELVREAEEATGILPADRFAEEDAFSEIREMAEGTPAQAAAAFAAAKKVRDALDRYAGLVGSLAGPAGQAVVERERGRWEELIDRLRVRLAGGRAVVVYRDAAPRRR